MLLIAIWGTSFLFIEISLESFSPLAIVAIRVLTAALVSLIVMWSQGLRLPRDRAFWGAIGLLAFFGTGLPFLTITIGQQTISSGIAGLLMAIMPLATMVLAHFMLSDERLNIQRVVNMQNSAAWIPKNKLNTLFLERFNQNFSAR